MAVGNVSRKKSRALMDRSPLPLRQTMRRAPAAMRTAGQSDAGSAWATEPPIVPQLRTCGSPMRRGDVLEHRVVVADDRVLVDLPVGRPGADAQVVVRLDDGVHAVDVAKVDEQCRLREPELDQRDEAVAAGKQLGLAFAVLEDPQRLVQVRRTDVVELAGDHRAGALLPARAGRCGGTRRRGGAGAVATFAGRAVGASWVRPDRFGLTLRMSIAPWSFARQRSAT